MLLHAAALGLLLLSRRPDPPTPIAPSYDLVFENGGSSTQPTAPDRALEQPAEPPAADLPRPPLPVPEPPTPAASQPVQPSVPEPEPTPVPPESTVPAPAEPSPAEPVPQPAPEPTPAITTPVPPPAPTTTPETAIPESPSPAEAAPLPVPQALAVPEPAPQTAPPAPPLAEAPPTRPAPTVRLTEPDAVPPPLSPQALAPDLPALLPPPPLPPLPRPRQQAQQRPAQGAFPPPIDLNYGPAASRAPAPRVAGSSRAIDFSLGAPKPGPNKSEAFFDIRAANIGADWAQGLAVYWRRHRYYPQQAAQNGEDGTVGIEIVVNRLGRVISVEVKSRSGSSWLDMAAVGTWRNAQLAPLPFENTDPTITIPLTINYVLIR